MKKRFIVLSIIIAGVITSAFILFNPSKGEEGDALFAMAKRGAFRVEVTSTGELSAEKYVEIMAPTRGRSFGIYNMKIERIVEEGTLVRKGDFVAQLDLSEIDKKIQAEKDRLNGIIADYENAGIDTALTLRDNRDGLINLDYRIEEKQL